MVFRPPIQQRADLIFAKSLQIIFGLLGTAVRSFAVAVLALEILWGLGLAGLCFWVASQGSTVRGILAAAAALLLVTICALVIAVYFASLTVVRKAVSDAGLGRTIFDALFDYALGVAGEDTGVRPESARVPTHLSKEEVEQTLDKASKILLNVEAPATRWAGPFFWLAKQIQRIAIWATVRVIVKSCSHDGKSVNMFELRDRLASTIDDGVVSYLQQHFLRLAIGVIIAVSLLSVLLAVGISYLPF